MTVTESVSAERMARASDEGSDGSGAGAGAGNMPKCPDGPGKFHLLLIILCKIYTFITT